MQQIHIYQNLKALFTFGMTAVKYTIANNVIKSSLYLSVALIIYNALVGVIILYSIILTGMLS